MNMSELLVKEYFETLIKYQSKDVVNLLTKLFDKQINYEEWIKDTYNDIIDSYKD
jgi:hypothetical protein